MRDGASAHNKLCSIFLCFGKNRGSHAECSFLVGEKTWRANALASSIVSNRRTAKSGDEIFEVVWIEGVIFAAEPFTLHVWTVIGCNLHVEWVQNSSFDLVKANLFNKQVKEVSRFGFTSIFNL